MRIAAIDIGTNSIHMVVARATGPSAFEVIDREREVVQIGRGSFASRRLKAGAIRRTVAALARFVQLARRHEVDHILCTATAAVREARNGGDFLSAAATTAGVTPLVIPAEEEGRLIYLGVTRALDIGREPSLILDIGGGSAQFVIATRRRMVAAASAPLGALRLGELLIDSDPPTRTQLEALDHFVRKALRGPIARTSSHRPRAAFGSSGSIHALAHAAHEFETGAPIRQINGYVLTRTSLERTVRRLQRMRAAERERLRGIDAPRAKIIVPGGIVLLRVLEALDLDGITISDFGVREGLVHDFLTTHGQEITSLESIADLRLRSVMHLSNRFHTHLPHAQHVTRLAVELFDGFREVHGLGDADRDFLEFAGLLHDVGAVIGYDGHAEHSYYVIAHGNLRGLSADDVECVALVARFHSKARPTRRFKAFRRLTKRGRRRVRWLSALLRIAEGLDRSHYQLVRRVSVQRESGRWTLRVATHRDAQLELWAGRRRARSLAKLLGEEVAIEIEPRAPSPAAAPSRDGGADLGRELRPTHEAKPSPRLRGEQARSRHARARQSP